jgi:gluconolactonase
MKSKATIFVVLGLLFALLASAQRKREQAPTPATDRVTPEIQGVVHAGTPIEVIKYGMRGSDGVVGLPDGSIVLSANGGVMKVDPNGNMTTLVEKSENAAGLAVDAKGRIIAAQYTRKVSVLYPPESAALLTDKFDGKPYIRPNDLVVDKKGGIYFTDCYQIGVAPKPTDLPQAVYYITPAGTVTRVIDDIARPNGITLSPDEKILYVNDWAGSYLLTYDVRPDGSLKNRRNFAKYDLAEKTDNGLVSGADGLCIDARSNTYATTPAGIQVFNSKGEHLGNIQAPYDDPPQNCGFGGPDKQYLYIVGRGAILRIHTIVQGYKRRGK